VQDHGHTECRRLPGRLAAGQSAADDVNTHDSGLWALCSGFGTRQANRKARR
jgi:hypothetical protein